MFTRRSPTGLRQSAASYRRPKCPGVLYPSKEAIDFSRNWDLRSLPYVEMPLCRQGFVQVGPQDFVDIFTKEYKKLENENHELAQRLSCCEAEAREMNGAALQTSAEVGARDAIITQLREGLTMAQEETETLRNSDKDLRQQLEASARAYKSRNEQLVQENQILLQEQADLNAKIAALEAVSEANHKAARIASAPTASTSSPGLEKLRGEFELVVNGVEGAVYEVEDLRSARIALEKRLGGAAVQRRNLNDINQRLGQDLEKLQREVDILRQRTGTGSAPPRAVDFPELYTQHVQSLEQELNNMRRQRDIAVQETDRLRQEVDILTQRLVDEPLFSVDEQEEAVVICGATQVRALRQSTYIQCMLNRTASDSLKEALEALVAEGIIAVDEGKQEQLLRALLGPIAANFDEYMLHNVRTFMLPLAKELDDFKMSNEQMRTSGSILEPRRSALTDQLQTLMDHAIDAITNSIHVHLDQLGYDVSRDDDRAVLFDRIKALMADQGLYLSTTVYDDLIDPLQARVAQLEESVQHAQAERLSMAQNANSYIASLQEQVETARRELAAHKRVHVNESAQAEVAAYKRAIRKQLQEAHAYILHGMEAIASLCENEPVEDTHTNAAEVLNTSARSENSGMEIRTEVAGSEASAAHTEVERAEEAYAEDAEAREGQGQDQQMV